MVKRALKPCAEPMCRNLVTSNKKHCDEHHKPSVSAAKKGYGSRWRRERKQWLFKNPFCVMCIKEKRGKVLANEVDHIKPHKGNQELFWNKGNWQSLCKKCHSRKTVKEDMGSWDF